MYICHDMIKIIEDKIEQIIVLSKIHRVSSIALFGSAAKGTMNEESDIDFLVQFSDELHLLDYADNYFSYLEKLEALMGRKIDLVTKKSLRNRVLIEEIEQSKVELYAA